MHRFLLSRSRARLKASAIIFSILAAAAAPQSWGLGLGEIELNSALNQEFNATIELFDAAGLEPGEILVSLGSSDDFQRVGVERFFFLTGLSFEVSYAANGEPQVVITSSRPITEPYLNFLVEVLWPNGRLLKEYTVLLDPPTFSQAAAPTVSAPAQNRSASNSGRVQRAPAQSGTQVQVAPRETPPAPSPLDRGIDGDEYGMTDRGDTLWSIASRARPSNDVSVEQTMLAIAELNPDAFINGNINLMKAGYVLRLPDEAQSRALSSEQALAEVSRQADEWQAYSRGEAVPERERRPVPQVADSTSDLRSPVDASAATTAATSAPASDGELRIVAEDGDSTTGVGQGGSGDLAAALEETDRLGMQVSELTYQLDREKELASNEIAVRDRQIEVKDQQIAELQAQLAAAQQGQPQASTPPATPTPTPTQSQNQSTPAEAAAPWWQSPMVMYGGAGALVLLLVAGMMASRKRRAQEEENDYFDAEEAFAEDERVEPALTEFDEPDADDEDSLDDTAEAVIEESFDDEVQESQTSDVIGEADIYIAYGRFPQAIGLLLGVLEDEPERNDVRLKLLEVYAETGDRSAFDQHMASLIEYCDDEDALLTARELEGQFGEEAITLDDMMAEEEQNNAADATAADDLGDLEFDTSDAAPAEDSDLTLDVSATDEMNVPEPVTADTEAADSLAEAEESALDFELELDDLDTADADSEDLETAAADAGAGDQLGGDLGIDFNPDAEEEKPEDNGIDFEAVKDELSLDDLETESTDGFGESEELTIDADLEQAAASISGEAAEFDAQTDTDDGDLALETATDSDEDPLEDLAFESATAQSEDEFDFEDEGDSANTKLDLARAYIDMGDADGARDILKEVLDEGNADQQQKAQSMLESL